MNGSGTTMLLDLLSKHSEIYGFRGETKVLPYLVKTFGTFPILDPERRKRAWKAVLSLSEFQNRNRGQAIPLPAKNEKQFQTVADMLSYAFKYFAAREHKERWCEKSPHNSFHMGLLSRAFPDARFIHIVRDGRDCAASFHRRWHRNPYLTILRWKRVLASTDRDRKEVGSRLFELQYEKLTAEPERFMREVCTFLGLSFEDSVLLSRQPETERVGQVGKVFRNSRRWDAYFSRAEIERMEGIAGIWLQRFGYPTEVAGDVEPFLINRVVWQLGDWRRAFRQEFERTFRSSRRGRWGRLVRSVGDAVRQAYANRL
jgi:hypothetical protein